MAVAIGGAGVSGCKRRAEERELPLAKKERACECREEILGEVAYKILTFLPQTKEQTKRTKLLPQRIAARINKAFYEGYRQQVNQDHIYLRMGFTDIKPYFYPWLRAEHPCPILREYEAMRLHFALLMVKNPLAHIRIEEKKPVLSSYGPLLTAHVILRQYKITVLPEMKSEGVLKSDYNKLTLIVDRELRAYAEEYTRIWKRLTSAPIEEDSPLLQDKALLFPYLLENARGLVKRNADNPLVVQAALEVDPTSFAEASLTFRSNIEWVEKALQAFCHYLEKEPADSLKRAAMGAFFRKLPATVLTEPRIQRLLFQAGLRLAGRL